MKLLIKNIFKKTKNSIGRFLSIMFIIALGISVFIGLSESTAGMLYTADNYYDESNLMDFKITSTYGLTVDDVNSLKALNNIEKVIPSYSIDVIDKGKSIRIHALEKKINNVILIKGQMPKNNNECLADFYRYKLNDKILFENDNLSDILSISECKVVGLIKSSLYVRDEKGISNVGNGKLVSFIFVNREAFTSEYYTEVYITSKESKEKNSYYKEYEESIVSLRKELEKLKPIRETIRYEEILLEANNKIIKIKKALNNKINSSLIELKEAKIKLYSGKKELETNKNNNLKKFELSKDELNKNKNIILSNLGSLGINENELNNYIFDLSETIKNLKSQLFLLEPNNEEYNNLYSQIVETEKNYNNLLLIKSNLDEINKGLSTLENNYTIFYNEISKEEAKLQQGYYDYEIGMKELEKAKEEANQKIIKAEKELNNIEKPIWYLLDRTDNSGYISYKEDIVKVDAIAKVLPIFFVIVVILMILNTLNRLIEEERTEMGILLSLGFSKINIILGYLIYVMTSGLLGIILGLIIGYSLIPHIIYSVFLARYYVPKLITIVSPLPFSLVIFVTLIIMIFVTVITCMKELKEVPASLLRYKPPKIGKKVFIERFGFLWIKMGFMWNTTIRNLFRYKKRIIMTILGVAGCTALLVAGMGINDSINTISKLQYKEIIKYDSMYILKNDITQMPSDLIELFKKNEVVNPILINQNAYTFSFNNKTEDVYLVIPSDIVNFNNYVNLRSSITDKKISISDNGAIITKQLADYLKVGIGDSISIRNSNNELLIFYVSDITYNYVSHYIYISENYYKEIFKINITYNSIIANGKMDSNVKLNDFDILMINYTDDIIETFDSFVSGLNKIIILIVVLACFLAFIVLYNLTIINVSERKREIATFKVLGFYDKEISIFVYRETLILTIIGILLGLFGGIYLHRFIMSTAETDNIMFLRKISTLSFILSGLITLLFSFLVQLIINKSLKKIDMIDSLKSIE
ncbi:MAG: FtsX-like permease family protein [Bacilli bacterium]|nr:FtsX-like permease family protein [Bacilli bacterium]MDD4406550.1 FtsX-like permease family protein [Bacilli bacterium]